MDMFFVAKHNGRMKYDAMKVFSDVVATQRSRLQLDVPGPDGRGWVPTGATVDTQGDSMLDERWQHDVRAGVTHLSEETWVPANDPHYDAKCFPHAAWLNMIGNDITVHAFIGLRLLSSPRSIRTARGRSWLKQALAAPSDTLGAACVLCRAGSGARLFGGSSSITVSSRQSSSSSRNDGANLAAGAHRIQQILIPSIACSALRSLQTFQNPRSGGKGSSETSLLYLTMQSSGSCLPW